MAGTPGRSGGRRRGRQGQQYPNRSDMRTQPPQAAQNQTYGEAGQQLAAQKAIPLSRQAAPSPGAPPSPTQAAPGGMGGGSPQVIPSLTAPTARPNEPLTAGLPTGAGPGPEALGSPQDPTLAMLRGAYQRFPNADMLALIKEASNRPGR